MISSKGSKTHLPINKISSNQQKIFLNDNANENSPLELQNTPNWIVGLTELHEKSIQSHMRRKSCNN
jgi:hypothetical protein